MTALRGMVTVGELHDAVATGDVDTVVVAFTDMQGRLQGKRIHADHFLAEVLSHGTEACNYLLAVDVDMNTVEGYAMSSWSRGYGDFVLKPDLGTLRRIPWQDGVVMVQADVLWHDGSGVAASDPQAAARVAERQGHGGRGRHRARVHRVRRQLRGGLGRRLPGPHVGEPVQRRLLTARRLTRGAAAARDPPRHGRCGTR